MAKSASAIALVVSVVVVVSVVSVVVVIVVFSLPSQHKHASPSVNAACNRLPEIISAVVLG
jgi:hypothetical protein